MNPIIRFKNFSFQYSAQKNPTLKNINLDIYPMEKILICGLSGSGKSTIGNCLNGLIPFSYEGKIDGSLVVDGIETKASSIFELSRHIGTVLQDSDGQFIGLTVAEDIAFYLENDNRQQKEMKEIVQKVAQMVGIEKRLENSPHDLSGGQKQRVGLAGVMVNDAKILLFDEPLANLDPKTGKSAIELIDEIQKETQATILIIEHRLEDVLWRKMDRIILMQDGEIIADDTPNNLLSSSILFDSGIREPLYLTALKYAGVEINPEKKPESIFSIELDEKDIRLVSDWYLENRIDKKENINEPILEVQNLSFAYSEEGNRVLEKINLKIKEQEMTAIIGENGAGKSTLAKLICGFEPLTEGKIFYKKEDIGNTSIRQRAAHIGYVMQNPNQMISQAMIFDEVALGLQNLGLSVEEIEKKVYDVLKVCGLYEFRKWPISALSYGQKKRVTIASVLVMGPDIIILDEPTAGQDYRHYTEIMEFLRELNQRGITILMITHDMHLMLEYTDRAIVLVKGQIVADTSSSEILCNLPLIKASSLKQTSLFDLAQKCGIEDPVSFVDCFIAYERERHHGS